MEAQPDFPDVGAGTLEPGLGVGAGRWAPEGKGVGQDARIKGKAVPEPELFPLHL